MGTKTFTINNTDYRVIKNHELWGMYEIEQLRRYYYEDGEPCDVWFPFEREMEQKIFNTQDEAVDYLFTKLNAK